MRKFVFAVLCIAVLAFASIALATATCTSYDEGTLTQIFRITSTAAADTVVTCTHTLGGIANEVTITPLLINASYARWWVSANTNATGVNLTAFTNGQSLNASPQVEVIIRRTHSIID